MPSIPCAKYSQKASTLAQSQQPWQMLLNAYPTATKKALGLAEGGLSHLPE